MTASRRVLSVYCGHNATAALLVDGRLAGCVSEERFSGVKNVWGYPERSVAWLLEQEGCAPRDLDLVAVGFTRISPNFSARRPAGRGAAASHSVRVAAWLRRLEAAASFRLPGLRGLHEAAYQAGWGVVGRYAASRESAWLAERFSLPRGSVRRLDHHRCHAATAYYGSPYAGEDALVLTLDGDGDGLCATVSEARGGSLRRIAATSATRSLGWLYQHVTEFLGMRPREDEYKVMGLAAYAKDAAVDRLYARLAPALDVGGARGLEFISPLDTFHADLFLRRALRGERFDVIAGAVQRLVETRVAQWARNAIQATGLRTVCLAGGVFMNVKANQRIAELPEVDRLFVAPSCGDESLPIGAAYAAHLDAGWPRPEPIRSAYLGPAFTGEDIAAALQGSDRTRFTVRRSPQPEHEAAALLAAGRIVARMAGRMEFGARALGNRSILAHPGRPGVVRVLNEAVKNRDFWMPFAPAILAERGDEYLVNPKRLSSPWMMLAFETTARGREHLPAAIHPYDLTARAQLVRAEDNPGFHALLTRFAELTGTGGVLNTSFNLHGEPIVAGPRDALRVFLHSGLDALVMDDHVLEKIP